ncbi:hypothetical protein M1D80_11860 [Phyllobacteriaceae bacterium JZ32]
MSDEKEADQGLSAAHTPPDRAPDAGDLPSRAEIAEAVAALADQIGRDDTEQLDLIEGSLDLDAVDPISAAANLVARPRRERGRPKGASNKRNTAVFDYLEALGHRDPAVTLSMIQSANTTALAHLMGCDPIEVLKVQVKAAADLMPFKYAKKPLDVNVNKTERHLFVAGNLGNIAPPSGAPNTLSIFGGKTIENQEVSEVETVRHETSKSHDET